MIIFYPVPYLESYNFNDNICILLITFLNLFVIYYIKILKKKKKKSSVNIKYLKLYIYDTD